MTSPFTRDILIRARVIQLRNDARDAAQRGAIDPSLYNKREPLAGAANGEIPHKTPTETIARPRPLLILPSDHARLRRLLMGMIHRRATPG
jgi:hypothetical protein